MIGCHKSSIGTLGNDIDEFIVVSLLVFFLVCLLQKSLIKAIVKGLIVGLLFYILYSSCISINYFQALALCVGAVIFLEYIYKIAIALCLDWAYQNRKKIVKLIKEYKRCIKDDK